MMTVELTYPLVLTPETIQTFQEKGYVLTENVIETLPLARHATSVDREVAKRTSSDKRNVDEKTEYEQSFIQCMRLWETSSDVRPLTFHAGLAGIAAQLLGVSSVRLWQDQALYKEPGGRDTDAHQDQTFWPIGEVPLVSAWIPFDAVRKINGAMSYVPGSHKAGPLRAVDITHSTEPYNILSDPALNGMSPEWVSVDPGSVVWHSGFTVHQAAANQSDGARRVFTIVYFADGFRRMKNWPVFPLDRAEVGVGELMQGEGLPVVWPVPDELPAPPYVLGQTTGPQHGAG
jgi:ectoine hydroxylase-related dioxygenase (phytanoyl-CoA dioxygenase family)